mmetsp:Transcript_29231/g.52227  ORF Transcript_29231/g.52227 Transcript_29231/m.52227 type:complete len:580 (-) Transcript_29231:1182-2921(-)
MLSLIVSKINKKKTPNLTSLISLAIATDARRCKEQMLLTFFEEMTVLERKLPMDDEDLTNLHDEKSTRFLGMFDKCLEFVLLKPEVQEERKNLQQRIDDYLKDLKISNYNQSLEFCRSTFHRLFDSLMASTVLTHTEVEKKLMDAIEEYHNTAMGPCADLVMADNITVIATFCLQTLKQADIDSQTQIEDLKAEVSRLTSALNNCYDAEKILHELIAEVTEKSTRSVVEKDEQLAALTASIEARVQTAEAKLRDIKRENQSIQIELEQAKKEKELLAETQTEIHEKHLEEVEQRYAKTLANNSKLNKQMEELRRDFDHALDDKNTTINELNRKIKQLECHTESSPRQDAIIVMQIKDYLEGIRSNFTNDQLSRKKAVHYMEQLSLVQNELNKIRLDEQSQRLRLSEDYETNKSSLRSQLEASTKHCVRLEQLCNSLQEALNRKKAEPTSPLKVEMPAESAEEKVERLVEPAESEIDMDTKISLLENHLEIQLELSESQRNTIEQLRIELDEKFELLNTLKYDVVAKEDDNDMLLQALNNILEYSKKLRPTLKNVFSAMHNPDLKAKVEAILTRHKIPFN